MNGQNNHQQQSLSHGGNNMPRYNGHPGNSGDFPQSSQQQQLGMPSQMNMGYGNPGGIPGQNQLGYGQHQAMMGQAQQRDRVEMHGHQNQDGYDTQGQPGMARYKYMGQRSPQQQQHQQMHPQQQQQPQPQQSMMNQGPIHHHHPPQYVQVDSQGYDYFAGGYQGQQQQGPYPPAQGNMPSHTGIHAPHLMMDRMAPGGHSGNLDQKQGQDDELKKHKEELIQKFQAIHAEIDKTSMSLNDFKQQQLPLARIKKIMKSDEDVRMISSEAPILFALACRLFITEITHKAAFHARKQQRKTLQRQDVFKVICEDETFDFLQDVIPPGEIPANINQTNNQRRIFEQVVLMHQMQRPQLMQQAAQSKGQVKQEPNGPQNQGSGRGEPAPAYEQRDPAEESKEQIQKGQNNNAKKDGGKPQD